MENETAAICGLPTRSNLQVSSQDALSYLTEQMCFSTTSVRILPLNLLLEWKYLNISRVSLFLRCWEKTHLCLPCNLSRKLFMFTIGNNECWGFWPYVARCFFCVCFWIKRWLVLDQNTPCDQRLLSWDQKHLCLLSNMHIHAPLWKFLCLLFERWKLCLKVRTWKTTQKYFKSLDSLINLFLLHVLRCFFLWREHLIEIIHFSTINSTGQKNRLT